MTREEAINVIKEHIDTYITCHGEEDTVAVSLDNVDVEAFDMAIQALEQTMWIPVWERLPEERGVYLVTQKAIFPGHVFRRIVGYAPNLYDVDEYDFADKKRPGWYEYDSEWGYRELDDVIAWMPLPLPWKAESEVQDADSN